MTDFIGTDARDLFVGGDENDVAYGFDEYDILIGAGGDDLLVGGEGKNDLYGDLGDDSLVGGSANDRLYDLDSGTITGGGGNDYIEASNYDDGRRDFYPGSGDILLLGGDGGDTFIIDRHGPEDRIVVDGGPDIDFLHLFHNAGELSVTFGPGGRDVIQLSPELGGGHGLIRLTDFTPGAGGDAITFGSVQYYGHFLAAALDTWEGRGNPFGLGFLRLAQHGADTVLEMDRDGGGDTYEALITFENTQADRFTNENFIGNRIDGSAPIDRVAVGDIFRNGFPGGYGDDYFRGRDGDDNIKGSWGYDTLRGGRGNDEFEDDLGNDQMFGGPGDDHITSNAGNDLLKGGVGNDWLGLNRHWLTKDHTTVMLGGGGDDFIFLLSNASGQTVEVDAGSGDDQVAAHFGGAQYLITLGRGRDVVHPHAIDGGGPTPIVMDFTPGPRGDIVDTTVAADPFASELWILEQRGSDTVILEGGQGAWFDVLVLRGVDMTSLTAENFNGDDPWAV